MRKTTMTLTMIGLFFALNATHLLGASAGEVSDNPVCGHNPNDSTLPYDPKVFHFSHTMTEDNGYLRTYFAPEVTWDGQTYTLDTDLSAEFCAGAGYSRYNVGVEHATPFHWVLTPNENGLALACEHANAIAIVCGDPKGEASKFYSRRIQNSDGTVSIENPRFLYRGKLLPIDARFSNGVCKLFGFTRDVDMTSTNNGDSGKNILSAQIDFESSGSFFFQLFGNNRTPVVKLTCAGAFHGH